uniref:Uncharacterized protein n=1 Tax=Anguilla anguilla TaxID=7936 RepID=A0A0E9QT59_ANGAN
MLFCHIEDSQSARPFVRVSAFQYFSFIWCFLL